MWTLPKFVTGDAVEVRSKEEILATLDADGRLAGMPFMPEMLRYCGQKFVVEAVSHKTCDTACKTGGRKLDRMVHLSGLRCDGSGHDDCEADCNLFWRDEWLRPAAGRVAPQAGGAAERSSSGCTEERLHELTRTGDSQAYVCQATQLFAASRPLAWWDIRQYVRDVTSGNNSTAKAIRVLGLAAVNKLMRMPFGYRAFRSFYSWLHRVVTGRPSPYVWGSVPDGSATPSVSLDLVPGEYVRIKSAEEIATTLNSENRNRGMWFGPDQAPYCGDTFRVRRRVTRIIDESSGKMLTMRSPCITLEGVVCRGHYSDGRLMCPRAITPYWREGWLERLDAAPPAGSAKKA